MDVRPARMNDTFTLYTWRVHGEQEKWYIGKKTTRAAHDEWFALMLRSPAVRIWIAEENGEPIGTIRLDSNNELTVHVAAAYRNMGYGTALIKWACEHAGGRVKASIDHENTAALKAFKKAGFDHHTNVDFFLWRTS